ncbi:MAG: hypothetical protein PHQ04_08870 [Opitutaceae bacterium]|nr:hypothetical protein [Opitutaceae bacterium]
MKTRISARAPIPVNRAFSRECVDFFGEAVQLFGIPRSVGGIFGLLYASPEPLCFSDSGEQCFIRLTSNRPFEELAGDPGWEELLAALAKLGLSQAHSS